MSGVVGHITFGPTRTAEEARGWAEMQRQTQIGTTVIGIATQMCNCIGPQGGERLCPCALRAEMEKASAMLRDGVTIAGQRYRLVLEAVA